MDWKTILISFSIMFGIMISFGIVIHVLTPNDWTEMVEREMENCSACMDENHLTFENDTQNEIVAECESCHWCYWNDSVWDNA